MVLPRETRRLDTYHPVDDIIENTNCELHSKMKNISMKVVGGVAFTITL